MIGLGLDNRIINICNKTVVTSQSMINKLGMDSGECTTRISIHFWSLWPSMMILCPDSVCLVEVKQISPDVISLGPPHDTGCFWFLVYGVRKMYSQAWIYRVPQMNYPLFCRVLNHNMVCWTFVVSWKFNFCSLISWTGRNSTFQMFNSTY